MFLMKFVNNMIIVIEVDNLELKIKEVLLKNILVIFFIVIRMFV